MNSSTSHTSVHTTRSYVPGIRANDGTRERSSLSACSRGIFVPILESRSQPVLPICENENTRMNRGLLTLLSLMLFSLLLGSRPARAQDLIFDPRDYGAVGDGQTRDTDALQAAIDDCTASGGGVVRLAEGVFLAGPIFLKSKVTLQIEETALLQGSSDADDYRNGQKLHSLVNASQATQVAITGQGGIDGAGAPWWEAARQAKRDGLPDPPRPRLITLQNCTDVRVEGVTLTNSPMFHLVPSNCVGVEIHGLTIQAPADSPNTDGIDPSMCHAVRISDCVIDVGDDNIAIKSGKFDPRYPDAACSDIVIQNCQFLHGHGMSIGSETVGGVRDLLVQSCTFQDTQNGIRIKSARDRGGLNAGLRYRDITMVNVSSAIVITAYYPRIPKPGEDPGQDVSPTTPRYHDIEIENLTATGSRSAGMVIGLPEAQFDTIWLRNVQISASTGLAVRNGVLDVSQVTIKTDSGPDYILQENAIVRMH